MNKEDKDSIGGPSALNDVPDQSKSKKIVLIDLGSARTETKGNAGGANDLPIKQGRDGIIP